MNIKVRLLKDWNFQKAGDVVDVFEPTAKNWIATGIAEDFLESRAIPAETATARPDEKLERAVRSPARRRA